MLQAGYNAKKSRSMIIDSLSNAKKYYSLHPHFEKAFEFILKQDLAGMEPGKYPVDGDNINASVFMKDGLKAADGKPEAHNNFIDIQVCPAGTETMGWKSRETCVSPKGEYNPEKDVIFFNDQPDTYFNLISGQFAIFFPEDVHTPMIGEGPIKKMVVKIKI
jgi:biofilm protein TabA